MREQSVKREQSVAKGFAVLSFAGILVKVLSLLYIPFLIAIIGEEGNGIYAAAYQIYVLIYVLSNSGIPVAISKLVSELIAVGNYKDAVRSFKIARFFLIIIGFVMTSLLLIFASLITHIIHFQKAYLAVLALAPTLLFTCVASSYRGYFQGRGNMTPTAMSQILEQVVNTIFTLVFAVLLMRFGIEAACAGGTIGTSLGALLSATFLMVLHNKAGKLRVPRQDSSIQRYTYSQLARKIMNYSIPITLSSGLVYFGVVIDLWNTKSRLLSSGLADKTATQMYSHLYKYQQLLNAPIAIVVALAATILPAIAGAVALRDKDQLNNRVNFAFKVCFLFTIPSAVGFSVLSRPVFNLLKYGEGAYLMQFGSIVLVMLATTQIQTSILQGAGKLYLVTLNLVLGIISKIITNYFLIAIPSINVSGAIIGSIVGHFITISLNLIIMRKYLDIKLNPFALIIKPIVAAAVMGVTVFGTYKIFTVLFFFMKSGYIINAVSLIISIIVGGAVYFVSMVFLRGLSQEDLNIVPGRIASLIPAALLNRVKQD